MVEVLFYTLSTVGYKMNNNDIFVGSNNKITIQCEQSFSETKLSQITQSINSSINGEPEILIDEWLKLNGSVWKDFIFTNEDSFQKAEHKLLEELSKANTTAKRGYLVGSLFNEIEFLEVDAFLKQITEKTRVNEILWANSASENDERSFISLVLVD